MDSVLRLPSTGRAQAANSSHGQREDRLPEIRKLLKDAKEPEEAGEMQRALEISSRKRWRMNEADEAGAEADEAGEDRA